MCETYLVITDNYVDGCSGSELIKRARIHGFIDDIEMKTSTLLEFDFSDMKDIHNEAFVEQVEIKKCPRGNFPWGTFYIKFRFRNCTFIFISYIIKRK